MPRSLLLKVLSLGGLHLRFCSLGDLLHLVLYLEAYFLGI